jgi:hypothetical protein
MTQRVGIHHVPAGKAQACEWPAYDVIRIEVPEVPVLGQMRFEADQLPTDLAAFNKEMQREISKAVACGYDHGVMACRADPNTPFIDKGYERIFQIMHSDDPAKHTEHVERSTKSWREETHESIEWVEFPDRG